MKNQGYSPTTRAQRLLLCACLASTECFRRMFGDVRLKWFDVPSYRAIAEHLIYGAARFPLSESHCVVFAYLRRWAQASVGLDWGAEFDAAVNQLRDESQIQAYLSATDPQDKRTLRDTMSATAWQRLVYRRRARSPSDSDVVAAFLRDLDRQRGTP